MQNDPVNLIDPLGLMLSDIGVYQTTNERVARGLDYQLVLNLRQMSNQSSSSSNSHSANTALHESGHSGGGQQDEEAQRRSEFPTFNQADQANVDQAIRDAQVAVSTISPDGTNQLSRMLITFFRKSGDDTSPEAAIDALDASSGWQVSRDANGNLITLNTKQNVFDGRTSQLPVTDNGRQMTIAQFFRDNPTVNATTYGGIVFLGPGFFSNLDRVGRSKAMIHEGVVHRGFGRGDTDFGATRSAGSIQINEFIDSIYPR